MCTSLPSEKGGLGVPGGSYPSPSSASRGEWFPRYHWQQLERHALLAFPSQDSVSWIWVMEEQSRIHRR